MFIKFIFIINIFSDLAVKNLIIKFFIIPKNVYSTILRAAKERITIKTNYRRLI
jgi:hypothetical protein